MLLSIKFQLNLKKNKLIKQIKFQLRKWNNSSFYLYNIFRNEEKKMFFFKGREIYPYRVQQDILLENVIPIKRKGGQIKKNGGFKKKGIFFLSGKIEYLEAI